MGNNPGRITMFWDNVFKNMLALVTIWGAVAVLGVMVWVILGAAETANRFLVQIPIPNMRWLRWPKLPPIAWERISPDMKAVKKIFVVAGVVVIGVATPLFLALWTVQHAGVADPVAYVTSGVLLSAVVATVVGLVLLVRPASRASVREIGLLNALVLYIIAISWLVSVISVFPLALFSSG